MSDMQAGWDAAVEACLTGHEGCSFGGMTPASGYWLVADDCGLNHGETCTWCPAGATAGFAGWGPDLWSIWAVPACEEHAAAWAAGHPGWTRDAGLTPEPSWQELLDSLNPSARLVTEEYGRRMDEALLYGTGPRPDEPGFTGIGGLMGAVVDAQLSAVFLPVSKAPLPGPARMRYDQATKRWEAR